MNYPHPHGYRPPQPSSGGSSVLIIVLIVLVVVLVLGGGGCLLCLGIAASAGDLSDDAGVTVTTATPQPAATATAAPTATATVSPLATATASARPRAPTPAKPRTVDFVCPPGKAPGGAVRAGCLCGSDILGTACGAPGNFLDVTATPTGCRFVCN